MNKYTGTFTIQLMGKEYTLRPSFEAMVEFEDQTGKAVNEAFQEMTAGKMSFKTVASALWAGIKGQALWENNPKAELKFSVVGEMIKKDGITNHIKNATTFFSMALIPEADQIKMAEEGDEAVDQKKSTE